MSIEEAIERVKKAATNAWYWSSFDPEKRAKAFVQSFTESLQDGVGKVQAIDAEKVPDFINGYTNKALDYLRAKSRTASAAVAGPAKFNYRRNDAALKFEHKMHVEYSDYFDYFIKRTEKKQRAASGYDKPDAELLRQREKLEQAERQHEINLSGNKILRAGGPDDEIKRKLKEAGVDDNSISFMFRYRREDGSFIHGFGSDNSRATVARIKDRIALLEKKLSNVGREEPKLPVADGYMIQNHADNRLQLFFNGIPSAQVREALKKRGFKWSPQNKAWQRILTPDAVWTVTGNHTGSLFVPLGVKEEDVNTYAAAIKALKQPEPAKEQDTTRLRIAQAKAKAAAARIRILKLKDQ